MQTQYQKTVLKNGLRVLTEEIPGFPTLALGIWIDVGSRDETLQEAGLTHFIEHMLFKGTTRRSALDIAKEMDRLGGFSNAFTSRENTCLHAKVLPEHLHQVLDLLADIFLHSRFAPEDVEREKKIVLQEIKMVEDSPEELVHDLFARFIWRDHPLGRPILGSWETVSGFTPHGVKAYFQKLYIGPRIVIAAAGNIAHKNLVDLASHYFGTVPSRGEDRPRQSPCPYFGLKVYPRDLEQVHFVLGVPTPGATAEERYAALLLNTLLGGNMSSRLFQEIREKRGLAYAVYSYLSLYRDIGVLGIYAAVEREKLSETLDVLHTEIKHLKQGLIKREEFDAALDHLKAALVLSSDNADARMSRLARNELTFSRYVSYAETLKRLETLRLEDIRSLAERLFDEKWTMVALGPIEESDLSI